MKKSGWVFKLISLLYSRNDRIIVSKRIFKFQSQMPRWLLFPFAEERAKSSRHYVFALKYNPVQGLPSWTGEGTLNRTLSPCRPPHLLIFADNHQRGCFHVIQVTPLIPTRQNQDTFVKSILYLLKIINIHF